jgi:hypothetical protein
MEILHRWMTKDAIAGLDPITLQPHPCKESSYFIKGNRG